MKKISTFVLFALSLTSLSLAMRPDPNATIYIPKKSIQQAVPPAPEGIRPGEILPMTSVYFPKEEMAKIEMSKFDKGVYKSAIASGVSEGLFLPELIAEQEAILAKSTAEIEAKAIYGAEWTANQSKLSEEDRATLQDLQQMEGISFTELLSF